MKQTILVTGGTGFIGSHTTVELQEAGYEVVIIDNLSNSNANVVDGIEKITGIRPAFEKVDCCDMEALEGVQHDRDEIHEDDARDQEVVAAAEEIVRRADLHHARQRLADRGKGCLGHVIPRLVACHRSFRLF